ncbi:MAG: dienelactone hydrolase family protein [Chloroflexi bacterium]|nr:dienelactone hydrolase family protein [Chloroflexota bacterium]
MPIYDPNRVEYGITNGHIQIVVEGGQQLPAYWSHPNMGSRFPAIALIHDWWGVTPFVRRMAHLFAQSGYYVVVPDLFNGQIATTPQAAIELVKGLGDNGYPRINAALSVLESHHNTNGDVAAIGIGMGGSLAFEAAILRPDLEAAVAYYGFPQRYLGRFKDAQAPILAFYGSEEPHVLPPVIARLRQELALSPLPHEVMMLEGVGRDFFSDSATDFQRERGRQALNHTFAFLEQFLQGPVRPPVRPG